MANFVQSPCDEVVIHAGVAAVPCAKSSAPWILAATILGSSMAFIDGTVVNVALPALQQSLHATVVDLQWVVEAYALLLASFLLVGGSLGDHYGRRRIFIIGVVLFSAASLWCGFATSIGQLILARAVQGAGGALLVPGSLAIISASFTDQDRGHAIGVWSGFTAITAAIGPVLGGWLIERISWRAVFFINLPLGLIVLLISFSCVPESRDENDDRRLDWLGAALATIGLTFLVYGLIESSRLGFGHPAVLAALITGGFTLVLFFYWEARARNPMLPLTLFRSHDFTGANLLTFFLYSALGGTLFFLPLNLIQVQGYTATAAGAALLPFILIMFLLSRWSGGLVTTYGAKLPLVVGPIISAAGFALFVVAGVGGDYWSKFFPAVVLLGLGMAVSVAPLTTTVMNAVPANRVGIASGINNAISRTAALLAIAALGIVMLHVFDRSIDSRLSTLGVSAEVRHSLDDQRINLAAASLPQDIEPSIRQVLKQAIDESFVNGFRRVMLVGSALALASGITSLLLIDGDAKSFRHR
ncbi:MAG: MFS transporter [Verrucomicrobia bacterium]|nr:MAG: MFS transporter [Verrucomicrobiota bacterium]